MNAECGFVAMKLPDVEVKGLDLAGCVSAMMEKLSELSKALCEGGADGSYSANEKRNVIDHAARLIATINESVAELPGDKKPDGKEQGKAHVREVA